MIASDQRDHLCHPVQPTWRDAPKVYGPHETLYNRFVRWSQTGLFNKIFHEFAHPHGTTECLMIDASI